jgi:hypothetical protein
VGGRVQAERHVGVGGDGRVVGPKGCAAAQGINAAAE